MTEYEVMRYTSSGKIFRSNRRGWIIASLVDDEWYHVVRRVSVHHRCKYEVNEAYVKVRDYESTATDSFNLYKLRSADQPERKSAAGASQAYCDYGAN
jgi:hypothetical protein